MSPFAQSGERSGAAASIAAKGLLQNLVVEPEHNGEGKQTGYYRVTSAKAAGWRICFAPSARRSRKP
jgi:hypothetical protein